MSAGVQEMSMGVQAIVGTDKAAFLLRSDSARNQWSIEGPLFKGWKVTATTRDAAGRRVPDEELFQV